MSKKKNRKTKAKPITKSADAPPVIATPVSSDVVLATESAAKREGRSNRFLLPVILVVAALGAAGFFVFHGRGSVSVGGCKGCNVLLITLDTTRADHLPAYGYKGVKTPNLDNIAKESFVFEDAIAHAPLTLPSHTSILTGLLPITHGVRDNGGYFVDEKDTTLAEVMKANGYATSAFVSSFVLMGRWKLNQGFDFYNDNFNLAEFTDINPRDIQRRGDETEVEAAHWLESHKDKRFFSWVHFYDPHDPYAPPEPYKSQYPGRPYDGEIAFTDDVVGRLLKKLDDLHLRKNTLIIITGDHGEGLGQHNEMTHAMFIYNTTQHVPLFISIPGGSHGRIPYTVRHIDIAPTILQLVGLKPVPQMQGKSLIDMMRGRDKSDRFAYSESMYPEIHYGWSRLVGITSGPYHYIQAPRPELYDREHDGGETHNLIAEKPQYARALAGRLQDLIASNTRKNLQGPQKMDADTAEKLRALGYVSGGVKATAESLKMDPKDKIQVARAVQAAFGACMRHNYDEAVELITPIVQQEPNMTDAHFIAGVAHSGKNDYKGAIDEFMKTIALMPDHTMALYNLGYAYQELGDTKSAEYWYKKVLQYEEKHLSATIKLANLYRTLNEPDKARPYFIRAVTFYEDSLKKTTSPKAKSALYATLGEIYFGAGDLQNSERSLKAAIELTPKEPHLHYNLAQIYEARNSGLEAASEYRLETEADPSNFKAFYNLGLLYQHMNLLADAARCFQRVIQLEPQEPHAYLQLAYTLKGMGKDQEANQLMKQAQEVQKQVNR